MVMSKAAALELAQDELIPQIGTQRTALSRFDAWLRGDNPMERRAHQDPNAAKNQLASLARTPMLRQIVEQLPSSSCSAAWRHRVTRRPRLDCGGRGISTAAPPSRVRSMRR